MVEVQNTKLAVHRDSWVTLDSLMYVHAWNEEYMCVHAHVAEHLRGGSASYQARPASSFLEYIIELKRAQLGLERDPNYSNSFTQNQ